MVFKLPFQITIFHSITSNNCNNVVPRVLRLYSETHQVVFDEEQPCVAQFAQTRIN